MNVTLQVIEGNRSEISKYITGREEIGIRKERWGAIHFRISHQKCNFILT
jgi:hypothetical protein